jgi:hypothetical protein
MASRISAHFGISSLKRYESALERFYAWSLSIFDLSIRVYDENRNTYFYFKTKDITQALCTTPSSSNLQRLVLENLNPLIGKEVTLEKVETFFKAFQTAHFMKKLETCTEEQAAELVRRRLVRFKLRHLKEIKYTRATLLKHLKPGDLIFSRRSQHTRVTYGQRCIAPFIRGKKERNGHMYNHISLYIGNGKLVEAWEKKPLHIVDISDRRFAPKPSMHNYVVSRCTDSNLAAEAARIAEKIALRELQRPAKSKPLKYSHTLAAQSLFRSPRFGSNARYRYLTHYLDDIRDRTPPSFFCSYFVGYCYQVAESHRVIPKLASDLPRKEGSAPVKTLRRTLWANKKRWKLWRKMNDQIQFKFDPKRTTPHELRNFVLKRPYLFRDLYLITA